MAILTASACLSSRPQPPAPSSLTEVNDLAKTVAALRRLPLKRALTVKASTEPVRPVNEYRGIASVQAVETAYKIVGLITADTNLGERLAEYRRIENLIRYDSGAASIALSGDVATLGEAFQLHPSRPPSAFPLLLAIMKALQEQHFNWSTAIDGAYSEDRRMALRAVAAGDALLTAMARAQESNAPRLTSAELTMAHRLADRWDRLGAELPDFLRRQLSFPYREGASFANWAFAGKGWDGVNALYADPPRTSAEILHPEKYFMERGAPLRFFPAGFLLRMKIGTTFEQSIGESLIGALLEREVSPKAAATMAAAWRGDRLFFFHDGASAVTVWYSAWENAASADKFSAAYRAVLETRQRVRFRPAPQSKNNFLIAEARDRGAMALQVNGSNVVLLQATEAGRMTELAGALWHDLEIAPDSKFIPWELGRARGQLSLSKR